MASKPSRPSSPYRSRQSESRQSESSITSRFYREFIHNHKPIEYCYTLETNRICLYPGKIHDSIRNLPINELDILPLYTKLDGLSIIINSFLDITDTQVSELNQNLTRFNEGNLKKLNDSIEKIYLKNIFNCITYIVKTYNEKRSITNEIFLEEIAQFLFNIINNIDRINILNVNNNIYIVKRETVGEQFGIRKTKVNKRQINSIEINIIKTKINSITNNGTYLELFKNKIKDLLGLYFKVIYQPEHPPQSPPKPPSVPPSQQQAPKPPPAQPSPKPPPALPPTQQKTKPIPENVATKTKRKIVGYSVNCKGGRKTSGSRKTRS